MEKIDVNRIRALQEKVTAKFFQQRAENEKMVDKMRDAITKYPDIRERLPEFDGDLTYQDLVPEVYKPMELIDVKVYKAQQARLDKITEAYNAIVVEEYEKALEIQRQADAVVSEG